ncbi:MAG: CDP-alcohol phosphatidyltransferase family protein [Candidatus Limivicinus sp.]|jgi:cardiolipin synthase
MKNTRTKDYSKKILTIPNALSLLRLLLVPVFIWLYVVKNNVPMTTAVLVFSGLTDIADGFIARTFNMISDFGKVLDPLADKITQLAMLFCLMYRFPHMLIPLIILAVKEITAAVTGGITVHKAGVVMSSEWHGKLTTASLYIMMVIHLLWPDISPTVSDALIGICVVFMLVSFVLYTVRNIKAVNAAKKSRKAKEAEGTEESGREEQKI